MQVEITAKGLKIDEKIRDLVEKKLVPKIDRLLPDLPEDEKLATLRFEKRSRYGYKVSMSLNLPKKKHVFAESKNEELTPAITELREEIVEQVRDYKEKLQNF